MVAESGLPFTVHKIALATGEQNQPTFRQINPAGLIPAIVDSDGPHGRPLSIAQSGAIVLYLAQKIGRFIPEDPADKMLALQWFMQACTDIAGTNAAITLSSTRVAARSEPTIQYFEELLTHYFEIIDTRLKLGPYLANDLSIADIALYPHFFRRQPLIKAAGLDRLLEWGQMMGARPGVIKGMSLAL